jgi:excisionase family DNA binding protein
MWITQFREGEKIMQQMIQQNLEELWTFKETMKYLRVSRSTLLRFMWSNRITGHKVGAHWRFYPSDVRALVSGSEQPAEQGE